MPNLKPIRITVWNKAKDCYEFKAPVYVNSSGEFRFTLPDELEDPVYEIIKNSNIRCSRTSKTKLLCIYGKTLDECIEITKQAAQQHINCEVKQEIVILYKYKSETSYVKDNENTFYSSGRELNDFYENASWYGSLQSLDRARFYNIGLFAKPMLKITYIRDSGIKTIYEFLNRREDESDYSESEIYLQKLKDFTHMYYDSSKDYSEMPYTEKTARFFYEAILSICKLSDKMYLFFKDDQNVINAIENQDKFLLLNSKGE